MKSYHTPRQSALDWETVAPLADFNFPWNPSPAPATIFRAAIVEDTFHFRYEVEDQDIVLGEGGTTNDKVLGSDRAEIFFATDRELSSYYCLEIDPRGLVFDCHMSFYRKMDDTWSCPGLRVAATTGPRGYQIDTSIPLQTLRDLKVLPPASQQIIAGLYRAEFSHGPDGKIHEDWISWIDPQTDTPDFHVPTSFGTLTLE